MRLVTVQECCWLFIVQIGTCLSSAHKCYIASPSSDAPIHTLLYFPTHNPQILLGEGPNNPPSVLCHSALICAVLHFESALCRFCWEKAPTTRSTSRFYKRAPTAQHSLWPMPRSLRLLPPSLPPPSLLLQQTRQPQPQSPPLREGQQQRPHGRRPRHDLRLLLIASSSHHSMTVF